MTGEPQPVRPRSVRPRSMRWLRAVIPFVVLACAWTVIIGAHAVEEPDLSDAGTLAPTGTGRHGSSRLAELLATRGVQIERVTSSDAARQAAAGSAATVFVPTPDYLRADLFTTITSGTHPRRVVVVQPGERTLRAAVPVLPGRDRWATATVGPGCTLPLATRAGPAGVSNRSYLIDAFEGSTPTATCYAHSVVAFRKGTTESIYVGATDPFRNDRIGESGNAELATGLLAEYPRVIWVDVHAREPAEGPDISLALPRYERAPQDRTSTGLPTIDAFPVWLWAGLLLFVVAAVLLAVAQARRLGPPVAEPLPVLVPAAEAVTGRGRLYRRAGARAATLETLRSAAIRRMALVLSPSGGRLADLDHTTVDSATLVRQVAERARLSERDVREILYGPPPTDDPGLTEAVSRLDALVAAVTGAMASAPYTRGDAP